MEKYWQGETKDNEIITEKSGKSWEEYRKKLKSLELVLEDGRTIALPNNKEYIQAKTASANLTSGESKIESRYIGFKENGKIIIVRVDEKTNNINVEIT